MSDVQYYLDLTLPAVICGDFNMVENLKLDRKGGRPRGIHTYSKDALVNLKNDYSLALCKSTAHLPYVNPPPHRPCVNLPPLCKSTAPPPLCKSTAPM